MGVLATDANAQVLLSRRLMWAGDDPGRALEAGWDAFSDLDTRQKQFAAIDLYLGLRALGLDPAAAIPSGAFETLGRYDVQLPLVAVGPGEMGVFGITDVRSPIVRRGDVSKRLMYMGDTPDKFSRTGGEVVERMRTEGLIAGEGELLRGNPNNLQLVAEDGTLVRIDGSVDMAHRTDAVTWWNEVGRFYGPKSPQVRQFMLDPDNYILQPRSVNRADGARLRVEYLPPAPPRR